MKEITILTVVVGVLFVGLLCASFFFSFFYGIVLLLFCCFVFDGLGVGAWGLFWGGFF